MIPAAYASSKAAMTTISETLRLELSPFGVDVITIMAGVVDSQFHANDTDFGLPPNSRYTAIKDIMAGWASGEAKPKGCSAEEFAESLMDVIAGKGSKGGLVWKGPHAGAVKFMVGWLPTSLVVSVQLCLISCQDIVTGMLTTSSDRTNS